MSETQTRLDLHETQRTGIKDNDLQYDHIFFNENS